MNALALVAPAPLASSAPARLLAAWLDGRSERTRLAYSQDLEAFRAFTGAASLDAAATLLLDRGHGAANELALSCRAHLRGRGLSPATINRHLASLRSLVGLARTLGMVPWALEVANLKTEAYRDTRGPGRSAVRSMVEELAGRVDPKAVRDLALLRLLHDLALRRNEAVTLDLAHLDLAGARVSVLRKGKAERLWLTLPGPTVAAVRAWLAVRGDAPGALFTGFRGGKGKRLAGGGVYRTVRGLGQAVGVKVRPHGLRHSSITAAVVAAQAAGLGLEQVRDFSGHADVKTLLIYRDRERNVQGQLAELVAASA